MSKLHLISKKYISDISLIISKKYNSCHIDKYRICQAISCTQKLEMCHNLRGAAYMLMFKIFQILLTQINEERYLYCNHILIIDS